jgi:protein TonB
MSEAGFLDRKPIRPGAAATVILLHGAALAALLLAKNPEVARRVFTPIDVFDVHVPPPPPPPPRTPDRPKEEVTHWDVPLRQPPIDSPITLPPTPPSPPPDFGSRPSERDVAGTLYRPPPQPPVRDDPPPPPPREVVRTEATMTSGDLQPPYPTSEQRLEREGRVVIRVTIGADGRVKAAQKVSATSDAFYTATERHARSRWRFRPATVDGRPVEATKTLTVVFRLDA